MRSIATGIAIWLGVIGFTQIVWAEPQPELIVPKYAYNPNLLKHAKNFERKSHPDRSRSYAQNLMREFNWDNKQFGCLNDLWERESNWKHTADNPKSSAYGIPQALPGSKMASEGSDWQTNPETQIRWGLRYISQRYENPCNAWKHFQQKNYY